MERTAVGAPETCDWIPLHYYLLPNERNKERRHLFFDTARRRLKAEGGRFLCDAQQACWPVLW